MRMRNTPPRAREIDFAAAMDELMKTLEGRQEDATVETPADVTGLLAVHIASVHTVREDTFEGSIADLLQLRIKFRDHTKHFSFSPTAGSNCHEGGLECGATKHIPIQLLKESESPDNWLSVELVIRSPLLRQEMDSVLAKALLHIYTIIHDSPLMGEVELKETSGEPFAVLTAEFVFTYGMFGFGESFQLHHHVRKAGHFLHRSMFPRIQPHENRADANCILVPLPLHRPSFIPFQQKSNQEGSSLTSNFRPQLLLSKMTRLGSLHAEYEKKKNRHQKLAFLQEVVWRKKSSDPYDIQVTARNQRP